jgi:hypothetical protein
VRKTALALLAALGLGAVLSLVVLCVPVKRIKAAPAAPVWAEIPWPFPMDQWGKGKAFACTGRDCGVDVTLYVRAKIGFCNCTTGVADDEELDRISDFELLGSQVAPQSPGRPITVAWMKGRSRAFALGRAKSALSVGINDRCDAIVATAVSAQDRAAAVEPAVLAFLNSQTILHWAEVTLGL